MKDNQDSLYRVRNLLPLAIVLAAVWSYFTSFVGVFVLDDTYHIVGNPHIRRLWPPWDALMNSSRPLVNLTLAINYHFGGLNVWGYHAVNLAIHIFAALTLFGVVRCTLLTRPLADRFAANSRWLALATAVIWTAHPLQTQSVTYIIQRGESLMGLLFLLTLYFVIRGAQSSRGFVWYLGAFLTCVLGICSKPIMVTAPVLVLLYDRVFLSESFRDLWAKRYLLYVGLMSTWGLLPVLLAQAPIEWETSAGFATKLATPFEYALTQTQVIVHYLRLSFWPQPLCLDYGWPIVRNASEVFIPATVVGALLLITVWSLFEYPCAGFLGAWFFVILIPTSSFIPIADIAFEHRMYLPSAAVVVFTVVLTHGGLDQLRKRLNKRHGRVLWIVEASLFATLLMALGHLTMERNKDYRTAVMIWTDTVSKRPNNPRAHNNLGNALTDNGNLEQAVTHYRRAIQLNPRYVLAYKNLAIALFRQGKLDAAISHFKEALRLKPDFADAHNGLGFALAEKGDLKAAESHYRESLRIKPDFPDALSNLGITLAKLGRDEEALVYFQKALVLKPDYSEAHNNLGNVLFRQGNITEAIPHYREAVRLSERYALAHYNLGIALTEAGQTMEAIQQLEKALRLAPHLEPAQRALQQIRAGMSHSEPLK